MFKAVCLNEGQQDRVSCATINTSLSLSSFKNKNFIEALATILSPLSKKKEVEGDQANPLLFMLCLSSCLSLIFLSSTVIHLPLHLLTQLLSPGQGYIVSVHLFPTGLMQTQKTAVNAASRDLSSKEL